jgi:hypothetical protein
MEKFPQHSPSPEEGEVFDRIVEEENEKDEREAITDSIQMDLRAGVGLSTEKEEVDWIKKYLNRFQGIMEENPQFYAEYKLNPLSTVQKIREKLYN